MTERIDSTEIWDSKWTGTNADPCVSVSLNGQEVATIDRGSTTSRIRGAVVLRFEGAVKVFAGRRAIKANIQDAIDYVRTWTRLGKRATTAEPFVLQQPIVEGDRINGKLVIRVAAPGLYVQGAHFPEYVDYADIKSHEPKEVENMARKPMIGHITVRRNDESDKWQVSYKVRVDRLVGWFDTPLAAHTAGVNRARLFGATLDCQCPTCMTDSNFETCQHKDMDGSKRCTNCGTCVHDFIINDDPGILVCRWQCGATLPGPGHVHEWASGQCMKCGTFNDGEKVGREAIACGRCGDYTDDLVRRPNEPDNAEWVCEGCDDSRSLNAVVCGECAGHGDELAQAGMDKKALCAITTTAQGYDWFSEYADGVALSNTDQGECTGCGHSNATETNDN